MRGELIIACLVLAGCASQRIYLDQHGHLPPVKTLKRCEYDVDKGRDYPSTDLWLLAVIADSHNRANLMDRCMELEGYWPRLR